MEETGLNISIFGLGYVGVVTAACLARDKHMVVGVDISAEKVDLINAGKCPIVEDQIEEFVKEGVINGRLRATTVPQHAVAATDMAIVCVGTPSNRFGALETSHVKAVTRQIGEALRHRANDFLVVIRSTMIPGTVRDRVIPLLEETSGKKLGAGLNVVYHPEFLREGSSIKDFYEPPKIVVGECIQGTGQPIMDLYKHIQAPRHLCSLEVAEMVKYSDNLFHAVKITFANEVGQICHSLGLDSRQVMDIFCTDTKLNISPAYLKPGFAFGGSCLPKDLRAILALAKPSHINIPMLQNVIESNRLQVERVLEMVTSANIKKIGFWGLAFKPGTDDLRQSPFVELAERLLGKGFPIRIWDELVQVNRLVGKNKAYIEQRLPHLAKLMVESGEELCVCDTIMLAHPVHVGEIAKWLDANIRVFDLTGANNFPRSDKYHAIV